LGKGERSAHPEMLAPPLKRKGRVGVGSVVGYFQIFGGGLEWRSGKAKILGLAGRVSKMDYLKVEKE